MEIRAITYFASIYPDGVEYPMETARKLLSAALDTYEESGIRVQSRRFATQPFPQMGVAPDKLAELVSEIRIYASLHKIAYVSLGPIGANDDPAYIDALPNVFAAAEGIFASVNIAHRTAGIDLGLLRRLARTIQHVSRITPDGLTNLYLGANANVGPGTPFFPAAYHDGGMDSFALAVEGADLAVEAFKGAATPDEARQRLTEAINNAAGHLVPVAQQLAEEYGVTFGGLDFSLAPFPGEGTSLARAMEHLGARISGSGMVAAASLVMNAIEAAEFPRCGFSGLMLPVLEDTALGERAGEGALSVNDLLLYSAVCGTGLDCIPLPGDIDEAALTGILLDVASLSLRLNKPLTARLMPLPGKKVGDPVAFPAFEYFTTSRVMAPPHGLGAGAFGGESSLRITAR